MQITRRRTVAVLAAAPVAMAGPRARAAGFPEHGRPISIIVPYAPGGVTDTGARIMAAALEPLLHTSVQVINRPGAASQVGLTELVRSKPDGYTLSYVVLPTVVTHYLDPKRQAIYTRQSFQPVAMHHLVPQVLAVRTDSPYRTLKDLVEAARANPGGLKVADSGLLGVPHSCVLMLQLAADVKFSSVHFTGGAPSITALLGGHVDVLAGATADALPQVKAGAFRVLGVAAEQPDWSMPQVPTMKAQGYDVIAASATGIVAPAGTPADVVAVLTGAMRQVIESPDHAKRLHDLALTPYYLDPAAYTKVWIDNENRMKPLLAKLAG
jgi:tripartite-type tricarboxylate transporter receptor subunit TctC